MDRPCSRGKMVTHPTLSEVLDSHADDVLAPDLHIQKKDICSVPGLSELGLGIVFLSFTLFLREKLLGRIFFRNFIKISANNQVDDPAISLHSSFWCIIISVSSWSSAAPLVLRPTSSFIPNLLWAHGAQRNLLYWDPHPLLSRPFLSSWCSAAPLVFLGLHPLFWFSLRWSCRVSNPPIRRMTRYKSPKKLLKGRGGFDEGKFDELSTSSVPSRFTSSSCGWAVEELFFNSSIFPM